MINVYPGPSQLFFSVRDHARTAFKTGIAELPPAGEAFTKLLEQTTRNLRELLAIPSGFSIFFIPSSDIARERIFHDLVFNRSAHLVYGETSHRFYEAARLSGKSPTRSEPKEEDLDEPLGPDASVELIALAHTENSNGVCLTADFLRRCNETNPQALIAIDAGSSLPFAGPAYEHSDAIFFDLHFGFGLPAGMAVWIANEKCMMRATEVRRQKDFQDSLFSLTNLYHYAEQGVVAGYPNAVLISVLSGVVTDMLARGIATIRRETEYKAALLYHQLDQHSLIEPVVRHRHLRSKTVIAADCGSHFHKISAELHRHGVIMGTGHGQFSTRHLKFANFPAHSREQFERLADILAAIR